MKRIHDSRGFSLIELLTVIAIIAILAGIMFVTFKSAKDKSRQTACLSNLQQIGTALEQYKLDNNRYPSCLLGLYTAGGSMDTCKDGLYPEYIKSIDDFTCPSAGAGDANTAVGPLSSFDATGTPIQVTYYYGDSYEWADYQGAGRLATYRLTWLPPGTGGVPDNKAVMDAAYAADPGNPDPDKDFARQLRFKNPDATTVVTWCMNHNMSNGKALVLFRDGHVVTIPAEKMTPGAPPAGNNLYRVLPRG
jgi:prepilin-type N-terminal cleavage/methylation domain-containing protein